MKRTTMFKAMLCDIVYDTWPPARKKREQCERLMAG
jgi:hypothetical protein